MPLDLSLLSGWMPIAIEELRTEIARQEAGGFVVQVFAGDTPTLAELKDQLSRAETIESNGGAASILPDVPDFRDAYPGDVLANEPTSPIMLYRGVYQVLGHYIPYAAQQIGDCLVAGTMITGETTKPVENVKPGDVVWTGEGKLSKVITTRAIETLKPLVRIHAVGCLPVTCTADHKVLVYRSAVVSGKKVTRAYYNRTIARKENRQEIIDVFEKMTPEWIVAGELTSNDYVLAPTKVDQVKVPDDELLATLWRDPSGRRMLGYFVGNGHASGGSVEFAMSIDAMSKEIVDTLIGLGYDPKLDDYGKSVKAWRIRVHSRSFVAWMRKTFYDGQDEKVFPGWAVGDVDFIAGLRVADGFDSRDGCCLDSTSLNVIYGVVATLRNLGFDPAVNLCSRSKGTYANAKPLYRVTWVLEKKRNHIWRDESFVCHPIKRIEFIEGPTTVYDIGVADSHHSFVANGIIVHNCVGFGHAHANDVSQCVEIALGEQSEFRETDTEFIYGESRKVSGNLGFFDGSYGAAAVKAMTKVGCVSREMLGADGTYSGSRAKSWGRSGPPAAVEAMAGPFKLGAVAKITDRQSAISALWNGLVITICSNQGFTMVRDSDGFCSARGRWAHCMHITAFDPAKNRYLIHQSWGPNTPSGPLYLDQPDNSFWADASVVERNIFGANDSWALMRSPDFVRRAMPSEWTREVA